MQFGFARWTRWATLVALVLSLLAPTVSQAVAAAAGQIAPWSEVCSTNPTRTTGQTGSTMPGDLAHVFAHCPYCALHHDLPALPAPAAAPGLGLDTALSHALPALFLHAPRTLPAWASAQPRAPPSLA